MFYGFIKKILNFLKTYNKAVNEVISPRVGIGSTVSPWPNFKYLKKEIVGTLQKTSTMAIDDSGDIHSLGYKNDR